MWPAFTLALLLLASGVHAAPAELPWPVTARRPLAIAVDGKRAYVATGDNHAELVVVDMDTGETLGTFDADGGADALSVRVIEPGVVKIGRRQSDAPEVYRLDVSDPAAIVVLETGERDRSARWRPAPLPPVRFRDVNGDGVFRLACLGDSNTVGPQRWCNRLVDLIDFEVVNVAVAGATVVTPNRLFESDASQQMAAALALDVDAVVLAFGTNDRLAGSTPEAIVDAYVAQAEVAIAAGLEAYVATTPPMGSGCSGRPCERITLANELLGLAFPGRTVDFFTGVTEQHFQPPDRLHLNAAGQALHAERAAAVIASPLR